MKFSVGDRILLKRTGEEGHVAALLGGGMLEVEVGGIVFPVYADEVDHPYLKWFTEKQKEKKTVVEQPLPLPEKQQPQKLARGIYLSFLPVFKMEQMEDVVDQLKVYLLNEQPYDIRFRYELKLPGASLFSLDGTLHAYGHLYLHPVSWEQMNEQPRFHWQLSAVEGKKQGPVLGGQLRIRPVKLFEHINDVLLRNEPTFSYLLLDDFVPASGEMKTAEKKQPLPVIGSLAPEPAPMPISLPRYEVDLHIEQLTSSHKGMSKGEMLQLQLDHLRYYLDLAIAHRQDRMVVIHGLGKGRLRDAVHEVLQQYPEVDRFVNEWHGRYGFGATEVWLKY